MFQKILIANRGEIACRIINTARRLGIQTVAIYSAADAHAMHVRAADEAIAVGPAPSSQSYLDIARIVAAARVSGAQAIHPGYGFLSENADFASACADAGVVFIGPTVEAIRIMGSKSAAKALMSRHGVPLVPGYYGAEQSLERLAAAARDVGTPLLIKASAGGGGRGMRVVRQFNEFNDALASAQREALAAFGDNAVLLERYVENPRHIEVQVFGDTHGNLVHLFERDCSVQRRHQKVIEEAPAVKLNDLQRKLLFEVALTAARAVSYVGAGTVEFIIDREGAIYFIEMNTRLQVEHPVTERVTGFDLVEWQFRVAAGESLPSAQANIHCHGHAIEVRVYAEDPTHDFLPSTGQLVHLQLPHASTHVRIDTGVAAGDAVTPYYDAMIAKVITDGATRRVAIQRMQHALAATELAGVSSNIVYLQKILAHRNYLDGGFDTHFLEDARADLLPQQSVVPSEAWLLAGFHSLASLIAETTRAAKDSTEPASPWATLPGFRINTAPEFHFSYRHHDDVSSVSIRKTSTGWTTRHAAEWHSITTFELTGKRLRLATPDRMIHGNVVTAGRDLHIFWSGDHYRLHPFDPLHTGDETVDAIDKLIAPMPGAIIAVLVKTGDKVARGTPLLILEAMKIEHTIFAPFDGTVSEVRFEVGDQVLAEGVELIKLEPSATDPE